MTTEIEDIVKLNKSFCNFRRHKEWIDALNKYGYDFAKTVKATSHIKVPMKIYRKAHWLFLQKKLYLSDYPSEFINLTILYAYAKEALDGYAKNSQRNSFSRS